MYTNISKADTENRKQEEHILKYEGEFQYDNNQEEKDTKQK